MKEKVSQWIQEGCDFNAGLTLLSSIGKNKHIARAMAGHEKRYAGKLFYELCKAAGYTMAEFQQIKATLQEIVEKLESEEGQVTDPPAVDPPADNPPAGDSPAADPPAADPPAPVPPSAETPVTVASEAATSGNLDQLPADVEKVIKEHADLFRLRAQLHEQMASLPEDNQDETVKKRKNLSDSIALISPRIDLLFAAKEAFYLEGKQPDMAVLFPEPPPAPPASEDDPLPVDADQLRKMKKNLQSANTKDQNMLDFQSEKKADKPNPMPAGPKRLKLEARIKDRTGQIEKIDFKLLSCS